VIRQYGCENGLPTADLLDILPGFEETVDPYTFLEGGSLPIDLALVKALARKYEHCRYLEIGTWRGESAANVATVAEECVTIDLPEEELTQRGFSGGFIANRRFFSKGFGNIEHVNHDSRTIDLATLGKFDLIFLDGDHDSESVRIDTQNAFQMLRDDNSAIVWHDYGTTPERVWWSVLAGILDGCPADKRASLYHVSNTLCAVYTGGKFETGFEAFPRVPDKRFTVAISATRL